MKRLTHYQGGNLNVLTSLVVSADYLSQRLPFKFVHSLAFLSSAAQSRFY